MKNLLVHSIAPARCENKSAGRTKQVTLAATLLLLVGSAYGQSFPDADQLLANVRLSQSQQQIDLRGQLRQEAKIVPFHLVQNGPLIRYIFTDPDETLQLRIGTKDSRLVEINRTGSEKITRLNEPVRGTVITYEDLALKFLYWPNARVIGSDFIRTRNCWKVQLPAPANDPQYGSVLLWVDKESGALMRMEGYDAPGKLIKRFEVVSAQKIEDRWYLKQMRVEKIDPKSGKAIARTYLEINK
jgi:outer membrane lipoprotein-sorting protein